MALNVTTAVFGENCNTATASPSLAQWDTEQVLQISGIDLPDSYKVEFSTVYTRNAIPAIGDASGVAIPNVLLQRSAPITAYIVLYGENGGRNREYWITIYITPGQPPETITPDPEQADVIDQAIAALNSGVARTEAAATSAEGSARDAEAAAVAVQNLSVAAETLATGEPATVEKTVDPETGAVTLNFGLPRGVKGDPLTYKDLTPKQKAELVQGPILEAQDAAVTAVGNVRASAVDAVRSAGTTQVNAVNQAGTTQTGAVNQAGANQVAAVNQAGATQVQAVEDKGNEVLDSIPPDYSDLADDVADLSRHLNQAITVGNLNQHIIFPLTSSTGEGGLRNNRASVEAITGGGAKITRTSSSTQLSYGFYTEFGDKFVNKLGHKIYIRIAGLDRTYAPNFSQYRIFLSYNGTTVSNSYKEFTDDAYTYVYTVTADFNQLTFILAQSNQITLGEYFTVSYVQLIDLTEMFGAGYEPSAEEFEAIYTDMPYARTIPDDVSPLREAKTLNLMLKNEMEKDYEVVENNAGLLVSTKNYVLVLNNDGVYGDGGPCWFAPQADTNQAGYVRQNGDRMFAIPNQGRLTNSIPPVDELFRLMKSYIGNDALVYGNSNTMFDSTTENYIDCSAFVSAVLQGIPYELSKYVATKNTAIYNICSHWVGVDSRSEFARLKSSNMAAYFAEHKCLYTMPTSRQDVAKTIKFGDILFMRDGTEATTHKYYGIGHVVIVLAVSVNRIVVAQCGGVASDLLENNFDSTVGKVSTILLTNDLIANYMPVFARPAYVQSREDNNKAIIDFLSTDEYVFDTSAMVPGRFVNTNNYGNVEASLSNAVSFKTFCVAPGSTLAFAGEAPTGIETYNYYVAQYDENMVFISLNSVKDAPLTLNSNTRFVKFEAYFPGNINFHYADTLRVKIVT